MLSLTKDGYIINFQTIAKRVACELNVEEENLLKAVEQAFMKEQYTCPAILKSSANKGKVCGRTAVHNGYCSLHKSQNNCETKIVETSCKTKNKPEPSVREILSPEKKPDRRLNNSDFDFVNESPKPFDDNIDFWRKGLRTTEINGQTFKQHRTTRLLLQIQQSDIVVKGLMHKGKPIWRESLGNTIIDWCNKCNLG